MDGGKLAPDAYLVSFVCLELFTASLSGACCYGVITEWKKDDEKGGIPQPWLSWLKSLKKAETMKNTRLLSTIICGFYCLSSTMTCIAYGLQLAGNYRDGMITVLVSSVIRHLILSLTLLLMIQRLSVFDGTVYEMSKKHRRGLLSVLVLFSVFFLIWNAINVASFLRTIRNDDNNDEQYTNKDAQRKRERVLSILTVVMVSVYCGTILSISFSFACRLIEMVSVQNSYRTSIVLPPNSPRSMNSPISSKTQSNGDVSTIDDTNDTNVIIQKKQTTPRMISNKNLFNSNQQRMLRLAVKHITLAMCKSVALLSASVLFFSFSAGRGRGRANAILASVILVNSLTWWISVCVYMAFPSADWMYRRVCKVCDDMMAQRTTGLALERESRKRGKRKDVSEMEEE